MAARCCHEQPVIVDPSLAQTAGGGVEQRAKTHQPRLQAQATSGGSLDFSFPWVQCVFFVERSRKPCQSSIESSGEDRPFLKVGLRVLGYGMLQKSVYSLCSVSKELPQISHAALK